MTSIEPYSPAYKAALVEMCESNRPLYFADHEIPEFAWFLDTNPSNYYMMLEQDRVVACGGIMLHSDGHVHLCWGMVHYREHRHGYGQKLLAFRIDLASRLYPGMKIILRTSQHTWRFFEKYGFRLNYTEKDFWGKGLDLYYMESKDISAASH